MLIDIRTCWLIVVMAATAISAVVLLVRGAYPIHLRRLINSCSLATFSLAAAFLLRLGRDWENDFFFYVLCHILFQFCLSLLYMMFCQLKGRVPHRFLLYGFPALSAVLGIWFTYIQRNTSLEISLQNTMSMVTLVLSAWTIAKPEEGRRPAADVICSIGLAVFALGTLLVIIDGLRRARISTEYDFGRSLAIYNPIAAILILSFAFPLFLMMLTERMNRILTKQAMRDPLTDLYNRRAFEEIACREIATTSRTAAPFSVLLIDLDGFKQVNDRFGHSGGDIVLREAARQLRCALRNEDLLCRWGGDEFCVLLPRAVATDAMLASERIRLTFESITQWPGADGVRITVSIGIAPTRGGQSQLGTLLQTADKALYRAKAAGKNRAVLIESGVPVPRPPSGR